MIKAMVAFDSKQGIATEQGIPWDLPTDRHFVHLTIQGQPVLMGYRTYQERPGPRKDGQSFVIVKPGTVLQDGFLPVSDVEQFLQTYKGDASDIWIMGGATVYAQLLPLIEELYITRIDEDFNCTKFFPKFEEQFKKIQSSPSQQENGLSFIQEIWRRK